MSCSFVDKGRLLVRHLGRSVQLYDLKSKAIVGQPLEDTSTTRLYPFPVPKSVCELRKRTISIRYMKHRMSSARCRSIASRFECAKEVRTRPTSTEMAI